MLYREILSEIAEDEFLLAADRTFEAAPDITRISPTEKRAAKAELPGLTRLSSYLKHYGILTWLVDLGGETKLSYGRNLETGLIRHNLTLIEWFNSQEHNYEDKYLKTTWDWLGSLHSRSLKNIMTRYLQQEKHAIRRQIDEDDFTFSPEVEAAASEYPAFAAFEDLLEERMRDREVTEQTRDEICRGVSLGILAIRESIEIAQFTQQFSRTA